MIPTPWRKMSELIWKGPDDACARVLSSTQSDHMTVRGFTAEVSGPLRETQREAIRDAERAMWAFEKAPERSTADVVDSLAFAIYVHTSGGTLDDAGRARYRRAAEVALQIAMGAAPDREALARALYTECETDRSQKWSARHPGASAAAPVWDRCIPEIREDWLSIADTAIRLVPTMTSGDLPRGSLPRGWVATPDELVWTSGHSYVENPRVPASPSGRLAARILSGQQVSTEDVQELRDRLAVVGRKIAQVEHERDEGRREIRIAHETLDAANVPRMAGEISDRIRRLDERLVLERREKHSARTERAEVKAEVERLRAHAKLTDELLAKAIDERDRALKDRDALGCEIANAGNALDEIGVCSANHLADRVRHLESLRKSWEAGTRAAISQRNDFERRWSDEVQAHRATRADLDHALKVRDAQSGEIANVGEALDAAGVPRNDGVLAHRIETLSRWKEGQAREKRTVSNERDLLLKELEHARAETRVAAVRRDLTEDEKQKAIAVRDDLIADYKARIGALEAINQRKVQAIALLSHELAEALGVKKVTS